MDGAIVDSGSGATALTKGGSSTWTLTASNGYTGATTVNNGTLKLDFSVSNPTSIISSSSALTLGGGNLTIAGNSGGNSQTFFSTAITAGGPAVTVTSPGAAENLTLGAITRSTGALVNFALPTSGSVGTTSGTASTALNDSGVYYATVGGTTWALKDGSNVNIVGATSGFYSPASTNAGGTNLNLDMDASFSVSNTATQSESSVRFNDSTAARTLTLGTGGTSRLLTLGNSAVLVSSNVGAFNATIGAGNAASSIRSGVTNKDLVFIQDNPAGFLNVNVQIVNKTSSTNGVTVGGVGTVVFSPATASIYSGPTYLDGGNLMIAANSSIGAPGSAAILNLQGGNLVGNGTFSLDNGTGVNNRPISLIGPGGGLAATATNTLTVPGVISGAGNLTVGQGTLAGTGGTNANASMAGNGTVTLSGANSYTAATTIAAGTLKLQPVVASTNNISTSKAISVGTGATLDVTSLTSGQIALARGPGPWRHRHGDGLDRRRSSDRRRQHDFRRHQHLPGNRRNQRHREAYDRRRAVCGGRHLCRQAQ